MVEELLAYNHSYNVNLAHYVGLECAVYLSELINQRVQNSSVFEVDRERVKRITTFTKAKQLKLDAKLHDSKILSVADGDMVQIDFTYLIGLFNCSIGDTEILTVDKKIPKDNIAKNKRMLIDLKNRLGNKTLKSGAVNVCYVSDSSLYGAFDEWLDAVFNRYGYVSNAVVVDAKKVLSKYAQNSDDAKQILHIAAVKAWRDLKYAGEAFLKQKWDESSQLQSTLGEEANLTGEVIF